MLKLLILWALMGRSSGFAPLGGGIVIGRNGISGVPRHSMGISAAGRGMGFRLRSVENDVEEEQNSVGQEKLKADGGIVKEAAVGFGEGDFGVESTKSSSDFTSPLSKRLYAFYKFTRPHTIRGTVLASIAGTTRALLDSPGACLNWGYMLPKAFIGMLALL